MASRFIGVHLRLNILSRFAARANRASHGTCPIMGDRPILACLRARSTMPPANAREIRMADRFAVITGAGSGIGRASALALMNDGWSVALCGRRKEMLEETAGMKTGGRSLVVQTDVTDPAQVDNLFARVRQEFGRLDMIFNNSGGGTPTTNFGDFTYEMWQRVVQVNLNGMF